MTVAVASVATAGVCVLLLVAWFGDVRRPLVIAIAFACFIAWFGQQGSLSYLGSPDASTEAWSGPLLTAFAAALSNLLIRPTRHPRALGHLAMPMSTRRQAVGVRLGLVALLLLAYRFAVFGVPVLSSSRFATVSGLSPQVALLTSAAVVVSVGLIATAPGPLSWGSRFLILAVMAGCFGTGSRLLLLAAMLALVTGRTGGGAWRFRPRHIAWGAAVAGLIAVVLLPAIYSLRASTDDGTAVLQYRVQRDGDIPPILLRTVGASTYISARNGTIVASHLLRTGQTPPHGYVGAAARHLGTVFPLAPAEEDPELYLTKSVFGLDPDVIGSIALPISSAFQLDFGLGACALLGIAVVLVFDLCAHVGPLSRSWWAFGFGISAYGMYLLSLQFVAIMVAFLILETVTSGGSTSNGSERNIDPEKTAK